MAKLIEKIQVNITFRMLIDSYLQLFLDMGLNPEILIDADTLINYSTEDYKKIADEFHKWGRIITFHGPFKDMAPASKDPDIRKITRKRFEQVLELVPVFKPVTVVCHSNYDRRLHEDHQQEWLEKSSEMWGWFAKELNRRGSMLVLENVFEENPEELASLLNDLNPDHAGFCLDTGHQNAFGKVALENWLKVLGHRLTQVHIHDNLGDYDDHLPMGKGVIDFTPLIDYLDRKKENMPIITLEPHREEDFLPSLEHLQNILKL